MYMYTNFFLHKYNLILKHLCYNYLQQPIRDHLQQPQPQYQASTEHTSLHAMRGKDSTVSLQDSYQRLMITQDQDTILSFIHQ